MMVTPPEGYVNLRVVCGTREVPLAAAATLLG